MARTHAKSAQCVVHCVVDALNKLPERSNVSPLPCIQLIAFRVSSLQSQRVSESTVVRVLDVLLDVLSETLCDWRDDTLNAISCM